MPTPRRLTAVVAASALGWATLALGVGTPAAHADVRAPHDPATYYAGTEGLVGVPLATELSTIISGHTSLTYGQLWTALPVTDADPSSPSTHLIDFYAGTSVLISNRCQADCPAGSWNREHSWAKSHGGFEDATVPGTDLFHLRPEYNNTNSSRSNLDFDETPAGPAVPWCDLCTRDSDSFEPREAIKGDLARGLFYMAVRYDGADGYPDLKMNDRTCNNGSGPDNANHGKLSTLIAWSLADPPDDLERARNDLVDGTYQHNRNPFIDRPEWVTAIWGNGVGQGPACGSTVEPEPSNPTVSPMTTSTTQGTPVTTTLTAVDSYGGPLTWTVTSAPANGTLSISGSDATYTPEPPFTGTDDATVTVTNIRGGSSSTTLSVTVTGGNQAPTTAPMTGSTPEDTPTDVTLSATDADDDPLTWSVTQAAAHGAATVSGSTLSYTPTANFHGTDQVGVTVSDGLGGSNSTTVTITVDPVNDAPVASPVTATTPEDTATTVTLSGDDVDGDGLTYAIANPPGHGSVTLSGTDAAYAPAPDFNGVDSFTWTVSDGTATTTGTATLTVTPVNDAPSVSSTLLRTTAGSPVSATIVTSDPDGDPVRISTVTSPARGSVTYSGTTVTYTPAAAGGDTFLVTVSDGKGGTATAQVGVQVTKAAAKTRLSAGMLKAGHPGVIKVKVRTVAGAAATGKVKLVVGKKKLAAKLNKMGVAKFRIAKLPEASKIKVMARYAGDSQYAAGTAKRTFKLKQ